jgi:hypothetical protein
MRPGCYTPAHVSPGKPIAAVTLDLISRSAVEQCHLRIIRGTT